MQFKKFKRRDEQAPAGTEYKGPEIKKPEVYEIVKKIDGLVSGDTLAKDYKNQGGQ